MILFKHKNYMISFSWTKEYTGTRIKKTPKAFLQNKTNLKKTH